MDENGNAAARGLAHIARKTLQHGYQGRVVCGHCWCALLWQDASDWSGCETIITLGQASMHQQAALSLAWEAALST